MIAYALRRILLIIPTLVLVIARSAAAWRSNPGGICNKMAPDCFALLAMTVNAGHYCFTTAPFLASTDFAAVGSTHQVSKSTAYLGEIAGRRNLSQ